MADVVLPATTFLEHDDVYRGGGHQYIILGPKLVEPPGECRNNHEVICGLAKRVGAEHRRLRHEPARIDRPDAAGVEARHARRTRSEPLDRLPAAIREGALSRRLRLAGRQIPLQAGLADTCRSAARIRAGRSPTCRRLPDHWTAIEEADDEHPFRLATSPARGFLNSTFNETPTSLAQEKRPTVMIHPDDAAALRDRRRRLCRARQYARRGAAARAAVRRRAARRADRGIDLAEFGLCRRLRHQHADRRGFHRALSAARRSTTTKVSGYRQQARADLIPRRARAYSDRS